MAIAHIHDFAKGLNTDVIPTELAQGYCTTAINVRFINGAVEQFTGIEDAGNASINPYWISPYATATTRYAVYGGIARAFAYGTTDNEITRYTEGAVISSITSVGTTATLTTATAHGRTTGDTVSIWGCTSTNYNVTAVITVTGANTFTYTIVSTGGVAASVVGLYSYNGARSDFTTALGDRWTTGALNGVFIANSPVDGLYYWNGDTSTRLRKFPNTNVSDVGRVFKNYIIQLAPTISGTKYPHRVTWSAAAEPGSIPSSFTASATNDAGFVDLAETPGPMVDCLPLGDTNIIYKQDGRFAQRYIGGNDVFSHQRLPGNDGLLARGCVVDVPGVGHVYWTAELDLRTHSGGASRSISQGRCQAFINARFGIATAKTDAFLCVNYAKTEVWACIPGATVTRCCVYAVVWNWVDDTITTFTLSTNSGGPYNLTAGCSGLWPTSLTTTTVDRTCLMVTSAPVAGVSKIGFTPGPSAASNYFGLTAQSSLMSRSGIDLGDSNRLKNIQRTRWNFSTTTPCTIEHGWSTNPAGTVTYGSAIAYTPGTTRFADGRTPSARYLAVRMTIPGGSAAAVQTLKSIDLDAAWAGNR